MVTLAVQNTNDKGQITVSPSQRQHHRYSQSLKSLSQPSSAHVAISPNSIAKTRLFHRRRKRQVPHDESQQDGFAQILHVALAHEVEDQVKRGEEESRFREDGRD